MDWSMTLMVYPRPLSLLKRHSAIDDGKVPVISGTALCKARRRTRDWGR